MLERRHSITICETPIKRKLSNEKNYSPKSNVSQQNSVDSMFSEENPDNAETDLETCNLKLDEVSHIRSVLTKAVLESLPIECNQRINIERGKVNKSSSILGGVHFYN